MILRPPEVGRICRGPRWLRCGSSNGSSGCPLLMSAWRIYTTPSEDLPQMLLISDKSLPVSGHLANFARYWIWGRYRGRDSSPGGGVGLGRLESSWTCLLLRLDINPKRGQISATPARARIMISRRVMTKVAICAQPYGPRAGELGHGTSRRRRIPSRADEGNQDWPRCLIRPRPRRTAL